MFGLIDLTSGRDEEVVAFLWSAEAANVFYRLRELLICPGGEFSDESLEF